MRPNTTGSRRPPANWESRDDRSIPNLPAADLAMIAAGDVRGWRGVHKGLRSKPATHSVGQRETPLGDDGSRRGLVHRVNARTRDRDSSSGWLMPMDIWGAPYICSESSYPVPKGFDMSDWTPSVTQGNAGLSTERDRAAGPTWAAPTEIRRNSLDGDALAGMNVLLVDDDYRNLFAIKALLERTKAAVKIAARGPDAFYAQQRTPISTSS
jgi:CheY-like chemotaxis protein